MNKVFAILLIMVSLISCDKDNDNINIPLISVPTVKLNTTYEVNITEDITYAEGLSHDSWNSANTSVVSLLMDSYVPDNDLQNRPLLMLIKAYIYMMGASTYKSYIPFEGFVGCV